MYLKMRFTERHSLIGQFIKFFLLIVNETFAALRVSQFAVNFLTEVQLTPHRFPELERVEE